MLHRSWGAIGAASLVLALAACGSSRLDGRNEARDAQSAADHPVVDAGFGCGANSPKSDGHACLCAADCASGFCADGVCCDQACSGVCQTCIAAGSLGTCLPIPSGTSPRAPDSCGTTEPGSCGFDGTCDGAGNCHNYPTSTVCKAPTCQGLSGSTMAFCDGKGSCQSTPLTICAPYDCDPSTGLCAESCDADFDCAAGLACTNGTCGPNRGGGICASDQDCLSGHCVQNLCCDTTCDGACVACNLSGRIGTCSTVPGCGADAGGGN